MRNREVRRCVAALDITELTTLYIHIYNFEDGNGSVRNRRYDS